MVSQKNRNRIGVSGRVEVIGSIFNGGGGDGDFEWMIRQDEFQDALFVFNDNEDQYKFHRDHPSDHDSEGCAPGGGNAIIRPYQCRQPPRAAGIPTGPDYFHLSPRIKQMIDEAVGTIQTIVRAEGYKRIFYSAENSNGNFGTGIFYVGDEVKAYIVDQLKRLSDDGQ
jgi:hypothetical protein